MSIDNFLKIYKLIHPLARIGSAGSVYGSRALYVIVLLKLLYL